MDAIIKIDWMFYLSLAEENEVNSQISHSTTTTTTWALFAGL